MVVRSSGDNVTRDRKVKRQAREGEPILRASRGRGLGSMVWPTHVNRRNRRNRQPAKEAVKLEPKGMQSGVGVPFLSTADEAPPANGRGLTH